MTLLVAGAGRCEGASIFSAHYHPCNVPAVFMVDNGDDKAYRMCAPCADHNVRNRGARIVGPYPPEDERS